MSRRRSRRRVGPDRGRPSPRGRPAVLAAVLATSAGVALALWYGLALRAPALATNAILVSIDTLRADHLGCYGYEGVATPHIDGLAAEGALFEQAITTTPLTLPAHASILTGRSPLLHGVVDNFGRRLAEEETTLAEILRAEGFATGGFVGSFVLDARWGIAQGFETYFDAFDAPADRIGRLEANERRGDEVLSRALEWIGERGDERWLAFLHFFDPHTPYDPPEPYRTRYGPDPRGLYDGEIAFVDELVGRLAAFLADRGLAERTLLVLVGDHGESLGEHGEAAHGFFVYDATMRVPLVLRGPGVPRGRRVAAQVRTIDVLPTILDLLGVDAPPPAADERIGGASLRPLLDSPEGGAHRVAYIETHYPRLHFGWAPLRGVRTGRLKLVDAPRPELYDLATDPAETENLAAGRPQTVAQLARLVGELEAYRAAETAATAPAEAEVAERLRALGYVAAPVGRGAAAGETGGADPKDKIDVYNRIAEARLATQTGETARAKSLLDEILEDDPEVLLAYVLRGNIALGERDYAAAARVFREALARAPDNLDALYGLALAYEGAGRTEDAAVGFARLLELDPGHVRAAYRLAELHLRQGRFAEAERIARATLARRTDASLRLLLADVLLATDRRAEARAELERAAENDPDNPLVLLSLGNVLLEDGDAAGALAVYRRAEGLAPDEARIANAIGNALVRQGDEAGALEAFRRAVRLDPAFAPARNNLGIALARAGRFEEAERAFREAIEADPDYAEAYNNLGFLYLQAGAVEAAIPLLRRAVALRPDYAQAKANLEAALRAAGATR